MTCKAIRASESVAMHATQECSGLYKFCFEACPSFDLGGFVEPSIHVKLQARHPLKYTRDYSGVVSGWLIVQRLAIAEQAYQCAGTLKVISLLHLGLLQNVRLS